MTVDNEQLLEGPTNPVDGDVLNTSIEPKKQFTLSPRAVAGIMLSLTSFYLIIELAFNARLLDVVGSFQVDAAIDGLEKNGRLISGAAVALLILGSYLNRFAKGEVIKYLPIRILIWCSVAMFVVYYGEKKLIDTLVSHSSDEDRRKAAVLVPMSKVMKTGTVDIPLLSLNSKDYDGPAGKTFIATLPLQAIADPVLFTSMEQIAPEIFRAFAEQGRNYSDGFYVTYKDSIQTIKSQYDTEYKDGSRKYRDAFGIDLISRQNQAWGDYQNLLSFKMRNMNPNNVPPKYWDRVRTEVRAQGIPVPDNWKPSDREAFDAAMEQKAQEEALANFRKESQARLHSTKPLDPNLSFEAYMQSEAVIEGWKDSLRIPSAAPLRVGMSSSQFRDEIYEMTIEADVKDYMLHNYASAENYGSGKQFQKTGEDSYRALVVPPIALVFSLLGAITHIFKVLMFAKKVTTDVPTRLYWLSFFGYLAFVLFVPMLFTNKVTNQVLYSRMEKYTQETGRSFTASGVRWVTQFQPFFYPVNSLVSTLVGSPKFDDEANVEEPKK